jgi:copper homeostasis protein
MLEVVVETVEDAIAARNGGADQLEVKCDYLEYGLTPTAGMVEQIRSHVDCPLLVMIRPHARSLVFSDFDLAAMVSDIHTFNKLGVDGFLAGCLTSNHEIDIQAMESLLEAAAHRDLHFHLAWEMTPNPLETLEQLIQMGAKSVRASGGGDIETQAPDNISVLKRYSRHVNKRIEIFLAGGLRLSNVARIVAATQITNVHSGSGVREPETRTGIVIEDKVQRFRQEMIVASQTK